MRHSPLEVKQQNFCLPDLHPMFKHPSINKILKINAEICATWIEFNGEKVSAYYHEIESKNKLKNLLLFQNYFNIDEETQRKIIKEIRVWQNSIGINNKFIQKVDNFYIKIGCCGLMLKYAVNRAEFAAYCDAFPRKQKAEKWLSRTQIFLKYNPRPTETEIIMAGGKDMWLQKYISKHPLMKSVVKISHIQGKEINKIHNFCLNYEPEKHQFKEPKI